MDVGDLTPADFMKYSVWAYGTDQEHQGGSECDVRPVRRLPVRHLVERVVGTQVSLGDGRRLWALLSGIDLQDEAYTDAAIQITLFSEGSRLHIVRLGQPACGGLSPDQAASRLGLSASVMFPIHYSLRGICLGGETVLQRSIAAEVKNPLAVGDHLAMVLRNAGFQGTD
jgi:hypothetical protein